jgi:metallo-beta-lactamase family protein
VRDGFKGKIHCTGATAEIAKIIMLDSAHIQEEDAKYKKKRHEREGRKGPYPEIPLYTTEDAKAVFPLFSPVNYEETVNVADGIKASFHDAGHVLGSAMIKVVAAEGGEERTIIFSGDVGRWDKPMLQDPTMFEKADYIVVESTYGDRLHEPDEDIDGELEVAINEGRKAGGNILIPSFALERSQEVLYHLYELRREKRIPRLMVFVDSPMAVNITDVFEEHAELFDDEMLAYMKNAESPFRYSGLKMVRSVDESKSINQISGTVIVIAGSGMCTGGRIKHHLANNISKENCTVLFVGYQAVGTLGRHIVDGAEEVRIHGQKRKVNARIVRIHGFSGHADRDELLQWLSGFKTKPKGVFVVHGETESAQSFADLLKGKKGWNATVPEYGDEIELK